MISRDKSRNGRDKSGPYEIALHEHMQLGTEQLYTEEAKYLHYQIENC